MPTILKKRDLGPLHEILLRACPPMKRLENKALTPDPEGIKSIAVLAELLGMCAWGVNLWIKKGRIPPKKAKVIADLSEGRVSLDEFSPFIFD